jgi:hypothetical protein
MFPIAVALTDDRRRKCERVLRTAIRHSEVENLRRAAQEAERDERYVARQIAGESGSIRLLMMLPDSFWSWLGVATAQEFGVTVSALVAGAIVCATCSTCDPWWLEHFWICIPR